MEKDGIVKMKEVKPNINQKKSSHEYSLTEEFLESGSCVECWVSKNDGTIPCEVDYCKY